MSLLTAAFAEAMFASRVAGLTLELDEDELELVSLGSAVVFVPLPGDVAVGVVAVVLLGDVVVGVRLLGVVLAGALGEVLVGVPLLGAVLVGVPGEALVGAVACPGEALAGVAASAAVVRRTEAVEAPPALLAPEPVEPEPVDVGAVEAAPPVSSCLARLASADFRAAFDCSSVTSALCGSSVASS